MEPRTHPAIALGPSGNLQGSVKFFSLETGCVLRRRNFIIIPMPKSIIVRVNYIGKREKQGRRFVFANRNRKDFDWSDEVPIDDQRFQGLLMLEPVAQYPDVPAELPGIEMEDEDGERPAVEDEEQPDEAGQAQLALENAGLGDGNGPVPDRRGVLVDAPVAQAEQEA